MAEHHHKWAPLPNTTKLVCQGCETVTDIDVLLANTASAAAKQSKIELLTSQLFAKDLKKSAHDAAYAWVMENNPQSLPATRQEILI